MGVLKAADRFLSGRITLSADAIIDALGGLVRWLLAFALIVYGTAIFAATADGALQAGCALLFGCDGGGGANHLCGRCRPLVRV